MQNISVAQNDQQQVQLIRLQFSTSALFPLHESKITRIFSEKKFVLYMPTILAFLLPINIESESILLR